MSQSRSDQHYATVMGQLTNLIAVGSLAVEGLVVAALWGRWRLVAITIGVFLAMLAFNMWLTKSLLPRWGAARSELLRVVVNTTFTVGVYHVTGWPLPIWFWLPFNALIFEGRPRLTWTLLTITCTTNIVVSVHDGVPWTISAAFTVFAIFARVISDARMKTIRDMFESSEAQRHALDHAHAELRGEAATRERVEHELRLAHKLEAVGRLAAGVAHEINTPLQFISDNIHFIDEATTELLELAPHLDTKDAAGESLAYVREHLPEALRSTNDGIGRVSAIVASLREFAHPSTARGRISPNDAVKAALVLSKHEYRYVADVETDLGDVPNVRANAGEVSQVLVNLIVNATHAITKRHEVEPGRGHILVSTRRDADNVVISIRDDGSGIDDSIRDKIFDPFFTTKPIGQGTGQGLAIAHAIIERHGGTITLASKSGVGTTFFVRLPVAPLAAIPDVNRAA